MFFAGNAFEEYKKEISNKKIIVYGCGDFLETMSSRYEELFPVTKIKYIVDKDEKKQGGTVSLGDKSFEIKSLKSFLNDSLGGCVLLIATRFYLKEILDELESFGQLKTLPYFILPLMISEHVDDVYELPEEAGSRGLKIPKKIHCCWFSGEEKDPLSKLCLESWKRYCPDYEIIEWNCSNYDIEKNNFMLGAYKAKRWASVADYARVDVLNSYGGIYFDFDVELYRNIDFLLKNDFFIGFGPIRDVEAAAFGSVKNGKIVQDMLRIYDDMEFPQNSRDVIIQPVYLCKLLKEKGISINGKLQTTSEMTIYPKNVFSDRQFFTGDIVKNKNSAGVHHCAGGWIPADRAKLKKESCDYIRHLLQALRVKECDD